jgi:hypothetical protein
MDIFITFMDGVLNKRFSPKDMSWGINLLCSVVFISNWTPEYNLSTALLPVICEFGTVFTVSE